MASPQYVAAIDQGTTSTRFMVFDRAGRIISLAQKEHGQIFPQPGWVEHDAMEIWRNTCELMGQGLEQAGISGGQLAALGVSNQRETVVLWDRATGDPLHNAVVWQCTRTRDMCEQLIADGGQDRFRAATGLPVATYFSGPKIAWLLDNVAGLRAAAESGKVLAGTIDSWLVWKLTGGPQGGAHVTDVTNASRTLLMDLATLAWDESILSLLNIPATILPRIVPSSDASIWGHTLESGADGPLGAKVPVCGALGDQQAALVGQACFDKGEAKNTYGTGCFLLLNTGNTPTPSWHGLITTVAYQLGNEPPTYCLEGSIAVAGSLVQWLRDNLELIRDAAQVETLARSVEDNGGVYVVPAFSGLFAPHWRSDARGVIAGLTRYATKAHLARAALEACAFQTRDIVEAMAKDSGVRLRALKVDGGMVVNDLLMQFQADILDTAVIRPKVTETTALGAAYAAGLAVDYWTDLNDLRRNWEQDRTFISSMDPDSRETLYDGWNKAVARTLHWVE